MNIKFLINGADVTPASVLRKVADECTEEVSQKVISKSARVVNVLRNNALQVLAGTRSGRQYKRPGTIRRVAGNYYRASAPGEPPAVRTGTLRQKGR